MPTHTDEPPFRRLVILVDPVTGNRLSLLAATDLAASLGAELEVLFVDDTDLLAVSELPAVRQVAPQARPGGEPTRAERDAAALVYQRRLRQEAAALAAERGVRSMFRAVRASLRAELPTVAETADLIIVERAARPLGSMIRLKAPALRAVHAVERPVLVLEESHAAPRQVLVVVSGAGEERAIIAAARIAAAGGARLEVRVAGGTEPASRLETLLSRLAPGLPAPPHLAAVEGSLETLLRSVREGLVVLDWSDRGPERAEDWRLVDEARCSVLVLR